MRTWRPARLTVGDVRLLTIVLGLAAIVRGADYWSVVEPPLPLTTLEGLLPRPALTALFVVGGLLLIAGVAARRHVLVFTGHAVLWVMYSGALVANALAYLPLHDGARHVGALMVVVGLHGLLMTRTGSHPLERP